MSTLSRVGEFYVTIPFWLHLYLIGFSTCAVSVGGSFAYNLMIHLHHKFLLRGIYLIILMNNGFLLDYPE